MDTRVDMFSMFWLEENIGYGILAGEDENVDRLSEMVEIVHILTTMDSDIRRALFAGDLAAVRKRKEMKPLSEALDTHKLRGHATTAGQAIITSTI